MLYKLMHHFKLLVAVIFDILLRFEKYIKFLLTGKHEFERICELDCDIHEKTMQFDRWLVRSKCRPIRQFFDSHLDYKLVQPDGIPMVTINGILNRFKHPDNVNQAIAKSRRSSLPAGRLVQSNLEDNDLVLIELQNSLTDRFVFVIMRAKKAKIRVEKRDLLRDIVYRIVSFHLSLMIAVNIASIKYDSSIPLHKEKLIGLWNNLLRDDEEKSSREQESRAFSRSTMNSALSSDESIVSSRWSLIGFQGEDPGTDFRGMGLLGLGQLEYLSRKSRYLARDLLKRSLHAQYEYPFAITGINITYNLMNLYKDGSIKHLYYDNGDTLFLNKRRNLSLIKTLNDLYVELYLRFDCFWRESKPENILVFNELMQEFISIIRMDMATRNFSMKFIY